MLDKQWQPKKKKLRQSGYLVIYEATFSGPCLLIHLSLSFQLLPFCLFSFCFTLSFLYFSFPCLFLPSISLLLPLSIYPLLAFPLHFKLSLSSFPYCPTYLSVRPRRGFVTSVCVLLKGSRTVLPNERVRCYCPTTLSRLFSFLSVFIYIYKTIIHVRQ